MRAVGNGRHFPTKEAAVAEVRRLQKRGVTNIDVGCMQVNLQYHPEAFGSPEQALDPLENAEYAAFHLVELHDRLRSWSRAVGTYHSGRLARSRAYWRRVSRIWQTERRRAYREAQREIETVHRRRRAVRAASLGAAVIYAPLGMPVIPQP